MEESRLKIDEKGKKVQEEGLFSFIFLLLLLLLLLRPLYSNRYIRWKQKVSFDQLICLS